MFLLLLPFLLALSLLHALSFPLAPYHSPLGGLGASPPPTDLPRQPVQRLAYLTRDGDFVVAVGEGGEEQEAAFGAGAEALARGFLQGDEAVVEEDDEGESFVEGGAGDGFLAGADGGGDEDGTGAGCGQQARLLLFEQGGVDAAGDVHAQLLGGGEQGEVADGRAHAAADIDIEAHAEEVGAGALQQEAAGVVGEIVQPALQLALAQEQLVIEAAGKEEAVGAVLGSCWLRLRSFSICSLMKRMP